jgi:phosphatidylglycerophosphate synthase
MADLGDGWVARRFGLATRFGAFADAALDKKATQEILDAVSEERLIPEVMETAIRTQNLSNMALTATAKLRHPHAELSPTLNGKRSMFLQGMAMGSYALAETIRHDYPRASKVVRAAGHLMGYTGLFHYGPRATNDYAARLR